MTGSSAVGVPAWGELGAGPWAAYLRGRGLDVPPGAPVEELPGGVSYVTLRVGDLVVKRPRALLAVAEPWPAATDRVLHEAAALRRFPGLAPPVLDLDEAGLVLTLGFAAGENWKDQLLAGHVDPAVAGLAGAALHRVHAAALDGVDGRDRFEQLRLSPYFGPLPAALPALAAELAAVTRRLRATRTHLVHGDYSPKNVLVRPGPEITVLDWEVACAGDPAFDVAFLLAHLVAKSVHRPADADRLDAAAAAFLAAYGPVDRDWLGRLLGALLLARTDGLSPLGYLDDRGRAAVRARGSALLSGGDLPW